MRYIYYCKDCGFVGSMEGVSALDVCPKCKKTLFSTHFAKDDWVNLSGDEKAALKEKWSRSSLASVPGASVLVTTGDLHEPYEILGPVYFQISNKGLFGSALGSYKKQYLDQINEMKLHGTMSQERADWGFLYGEWSVGQNDFEAAFFIATEELKKRARLVGGDAIIGMRQDIDMDTNGFSCFYLQMYGTAVRRIREADGKQKA